MQTSYRKLPDDVIQPCTSGRHPDAAAVLNDLFVSKPTGSEGPDHASSSIRILKNAFKDACMKNEDDMFELDIMIETNNSARYFLEQMYEHIMKPMKGIDITSNSDGIQCMIDIPPIERRAISRLYSEHGHKVLNLLKKMPKTTIPVILKRLKEKSEEWIALKTDMRISWKISSEKNYYKAYDYRFTVFKDADNKRLSETS